MNDLRQKDLFTDLPRGEQLAALRRLELDAWQRKSIKVSGKMQKAVLRVIDDHEGGRECFASQATIASEVGCSEASVGRAIAALIDQDLITKERPNHWSPNRHRVNWTAVMMLVRGTGNPSDVSTGQSDASCPHGDVSSPHSDASEPSKIPVRSVIRTGPFPHSEVRIAQETPIETPTINRPDEWAAVVAEMFDWGLKSATTAVNAARERGMSIELVRELFHESGGGGEATRFGPGQLANWLTGRTVPPFDHAAAVRRRDQRQREAEQHRSADADRIRQSVQASGRGQPDWLVSGLTYRKLRESGLESLATDAEVLGSGRMDEIDRQRGKRPPGVDSPTIETRRESSASPNKPDTPGGYFRPLGVPRVGVNQRRREIDRALLSVE